MISHAIQHAALSAEEAAAAVSALQQDDAYGEVWGSEVPQAEPLGLERFMVEQDKLFVVVAVVLVIWIGLLVFLFRTDRRIAALERRLERETPEA